MAKQEIHMLQKSGLYALNVMRRKGLFILMDITI